ncbi:MAG: GNAT family N-acetyltransferase, partial [Pseudomonadales bacterium]
GGYWVGFGPGPDCPYIDIKGSWNDYLASRSRSLRKQLRRNSSKLSAGGDINLRVVDTWPAVKEGLINYNDVEQRSWKPGKNLGVAKTAAHWQFYQAVVERLGPKQEVEFRFLEYNGQRIAATFGIVRAGRFAALHIAHDSQFDQYSPGFILSALELEDIYSKGKYTEYDFLGGFLSNKTTWSTATRSTGDLYAFSRTPRLTIYYSWHFVAIPKLKIIFRRLGIFDITLKAIQHVTDLRERWKNK